MKNKSYKKYAFQDNFIKHWCCSAENHPEGWAWWKRKTRKNQRRRMKQELKYEIEDAMNRNSE